MSSAATPRDPHSSAAQRLRVSSYEQTASWLVSLLVLLGLCTVCLIVMWYTSRLHVPIVAVPVQIADVGGGNESGVVGESMQLDAPNAEQLSRDTDLTERNFPQSVASIADAVSSRQAMLADVEQQGESRSKGGGKQQGTGNQSGKGQGDGPVGIPRANRWEVRFGDSRSIDDYARQLDFFQIELGLIGATQQVFYVHHLSDAKPQVRTGTREAEERLYMSWRRGTLGEADRDLVRRAGLAPESKVIVQFFPSAIENQLAQLEMAHAKLPAQQIRKTIFGVRAASKGFEFYVIEQFPLAAK